MDAVAHDVAHRAGIEIRPDRLRAVLCFGAEELFGDEIERVVPRDRREFAAAFGAGAAQRLLQAIGMMHAFGVARDLGADYAGGVGVVLGAADATDGVLPNTSTSSAQVDGQSCGQAEARILGRTSLIHCNRNLPRPRGAEQCVTRLNKNV